MELTTTTIIAVNAKIRVAIIDDHPDIQKTLTRILQLHNSMIDIVGVADSAPSGVELLTQTLTDVVFLDIQLAEGTGFHLLDAIADYEERFAVVIMSAQQDYALHAHKYGTVGYLVKPFDAEELENALARALKKVEHLRLARNHRDNQSLLSTLQEATMRVRLREGSGTLAIPFQDIVSIASLNGYSKLVLQNGTTHLVLNTLEDCKAQVQSAGIAKEHFAEEDFLEIERGMLLNLRYCMGWEDADRNAVAILKSGEQLNVAKRMKSTFVGKMKRRLRLK